jgi:hypothetical protein
VPYSNPILAFGGLPLTAYYPRERPYSSSGEEVGASYHVYARSRQRRDCKMQHPLLGGKVHAALESVLSPAAMLSMVNIREHLSDALISDHVLLFGPLLPLDRWFLEVSRAVDDHEMIWCLL